MSWFRWRSWKSVQRSATREPFSMPSWQVEERAALAAESFRVLFTVIAGRLSHLVAISGLAGAAVGTTIRWSTLAWIVAVFVLCCGHR